MKELIWCHDTLKLVQSFSVSVREEVGCILYLLQKGHTLPIVEDFSYAAEGLSGFWIEQKDNGYYGILFTLKYDNLAAKSIGTYDKIRIIHVIRNQQRILNEDDLESVKDKLELCW